MFKFSNILPFSSQEFYGYIFISIILVYLVKLLNNKLIPYKNVIFVINLSYLVFLFPKPIHLVVFILYGYLIFKILGVRYKRTGLLPILLYLAPLIVMKLTNILDNQEDKTTLMAFIFQLAGLSYMTFKMIQLYIDEKENREALNVINYFNFTAFTPTLLIGPIDRFGRFQQNINQGFRNLSAENFNTGWTYFIKGLLYKYIFAYAIHSLLISHLVNDGTVWYHLQYMYSYLFYLFFDFAGYSLLAMGFGYMLGIQVPYNFDKPFLATNPREFWQKWHKTLGDWLNDYFFKPIFKELTTKKVFKPIQRQSLALFLTFQLMGFWNGFELHYIVSGGLFGLYSVVHNYYSYLCKKNQREVLFGKASPTLVKWLSIFILFQAVAFSIYIFSGKLF